MFNKKGFTLVELLIVIAVIAILAAVAYVAIDPATRIKDANDAQRWSDCSALLEAVMQYIVDNDGSLPNESSWSAGTYYVLGTSSATCSAADTASGSSSGTTYSSLNLSDLTSNDYLAAIPYDPKTGSTSATDYYAYRSSGGIVTIGVCQPESADSISVSR